MPQTKRRTQQAGKSSKSRAFEYAHEVKWLDELGAPDSAGIIAHPKERAILRAVGRVLRSGDKEAAWTIITIIGKYDLIFGRRRKNAAAK